MSSRRAPHAKDRSGSDEKPGAKAVAAAPQIDDVYLPLRALVAYSGLSIRTLNKKFADQTHPLPFFRIGGKILVRKSDFDAWAAPFRRTRPAVDLNALVDEIVDGVE